MRILALVFVLLRATAIQAKTERQWKDAKVANITSSIQDNGAVVGTIGTTVVGGRVQTSETYYWLETEDITYVVEISYNPFRSRMAQPNGGHPLNVTLHGKTKIVIDGTNAHILDDAGKDVKVPIVLKVARTPAESPGK